MRLRAHAQSSNFAGLVHNSMPRSRTRRLRADGGGAAYEWCLNLAGWVSLSDSCHSQYRFCGSLHHQTADCPETQAAARAAAAEAEAAWAAVAAAAATKMQAHWRGQQRGERRRRRQRQNFPRLRRANSMAPCGAGHLCRGEARGRKPVRISSSHSRTAAQALTQLSSH